MTILIASSHTDPHARSVQWALAQHGIACQIIELTSLPCHGQISLVPDALPANTLQFRHSEATRQSGPGELDLSQVRAVWLRRAMLEPQHFDYAEVHQDDLIHVQHEMLAFIPGIWHTLCAVLGQHVQWLNGYAQAQAAQNKLLQLHLAQASGFAIPATLMSNDPAQIREFCRQHGGEIIIKPFKPKKWQQANGIRILPTTLIHSRDLQDDAPLQLCPAIYQNYVPKQFELRVLVLGEQLIALKLDSQAQAHSRIDWRTDADHGTMHAEPYVLDQRTATLIRRFMHNIQLRMGSIDLIMTPAGEIVFLEVNQQGQFLFLEDMCPQLPVLAAVCQFLTDAAGLSIKPAWPSYADYQASDDHAELMQAQRRERDQLRRAADTQTTVASTTATSHHFFQPDQPLAA